MAASSCRLHGSCSTHCCSSSSLVAVEVRRVFSQRLPMPLLISTLAPPVTRQRLRIRLSAEDTSTGNRLSAQEFESFLLERQASGDFVSKASYQLWKKEVLEVGEEKRQQAREKFAKLQKIGEEEVDTSFLKLSQARNWSSGGVVAPPVNSKSVNFDKERIKEDRRRASFLEYEALKRELSLLTTGVAAACIVYCFVSFSLEVAVSYSLGTGGSLLYLQLLFRHADRLSEENIPEVFMRRRPKRIGIRGSDLQDFFEKVLNGSSLALSSPRLVIPSALFGLWVICHRSDQVYLDLKLAPLMLGFFAYKAAALIQAYRDNKDLLIIFPEDRNSESK